VHVLLFNIYIYIYITARLIISVGRPWKMIKADDERGSYDVVPMTSDDGPTVVEFIRNYFFRHEPLIVCLDVSDDVESLERLQTHALDALDNGELNDVSITNKIADPPPSLFGGRFSIYKVRARGFGRQTWWSSEHDQYRFLSYCDPDGSNEFLE